MNGQTTRITAQPKGWWWCWGGGGGGEGFLMRRCSVWSCDGRPPKDTDELLVLNVVAEFLGLLTSKDEGVKADLLHLMASLLKAPAPTRTRSHGYTEARSKYVFHSADV